MKLYYYKGACSLAIRITIHEIGIKSEFEAVNLKTKQTETGKDFLAINPKGAVPTILTDQQEALTEGVAIQQYLADKYHATQLLPAVNDMRRYKVLEWLSFVNNDLHKLCAILFNPTIPADVRNNVFKPMLESKLKIADQYLQHRTFIMDEQFTVADAYMFVVLSWLPLFDMDIAKWPALAKHTGAVAKRPAVQKALAEEGLIPVHS
jgi:glutathione S-transferase